MKPYRSLAFGALTKAQRKALGLIAINQEPRCAPSTLRALLEREMITEGHRPLRGHPPVTVKTYSMPIHVHIAWCGWCAREEATDG